MRSTAEDPGEGHQAHALRRQLLKTYPTRNRPPSHKHASANYSGSSTSSTRHPVSDEVKVLQRIKELEQEKEELMAQLQPSRSQAPTPSGPEHQRSGQDLSANDPFLEIPYHQVRMTSR